MAEMGRVYEIVCGLHRWLVNPPLQIGLIRKIQRVLTRAVAILKASMQYFRKKPGFGAPVRKLNRINSIE